MENYAGRIVAFIVTPIVAGLTAWFVPWAAEHLPGHPNLDRDNLTLLAVAGIIAVGGAAYKWLENRGKHERGEAGYAEGGLIVFILFLLVVVIFLKAVTGSWLVLLLLLLILLAFFF